VCRRILLYTWWLALLFACRIFIDCFSARTIQTALPAGLSDVLQAGRNSTWLHEIVIDHQLCNHWYAHVQECNPLDTVTRFYSDGSDTGIFMPTYFIVLSLHVLQSFNSSFIGFASFSSFLISLSLVAFRMYVFLLICRQFLGCSQVICKPQIYSSCSRKPDNFSSFIVFFLSFDHPFFLLHFISPISVVILHYWNHFCSFIVMAVMEIISTSRRHW
jgi:hypothetical protein